MRVGKSGRGLNREGRVGSGLSWGRVVRVGRGEGRIRRRQAARTMLLFNTWNRENVIKYIRTPDPQIDKHPYEPHRQVTIV